jgi:hypothetical protein
VWHDCGRGELPHFYVSPPRCKLPLRHANPAPCFGRVILPGKRMRRRESGFEATEGGGRQAHAIAIAPGSLLMNARLLSCRRLVRACRGTRPCHRDDVNHRAAADSARLSHAVICSRPQAQVGWRGRREVGPRPTAVGLNAPPSPQRLRLLFLVNRSTQHAGETNTGVIDVFLNAGYLLLAPRARVCHMNRSQRTSVVQKIHVDQKTACAVLLRSVARLSSLFPLPTFSVVENESSTSWSMCAACTLRLFASVDCSSDISSSDFSVALSHVSTHRVWSAGVRTGLCQAGLRTA